MVAQRTGISLIEVMIATLIVSISIFGLLALLPVAGQQAERGLTLDRAASAGKNAVADFSVRRFAAGDVDTVNAAGNASPNVLATQLCVGSSPVPLVLTPARTYYIDPMFVSRYGNSGFPDVAGLPQAQRLNVRSAEIPDNVFVHWDQFSVPSFVPPAVPGAMSVPMADYVFTAKDDLVFDKNDDKQNTVDPTAPLLPNQQLGGTNSVRQTEGKITWAAMLQPLSATLRPENNQLENSRPGNYQLSIVVYHLRDLTRGSTEAVAQIVAGDFYSTGIGGGDVQISARAGQPATDVAIRTGQWVCLVPSSGTSWFQWYRVIDAEFDSTEMQTTRNITLDGPDWPMSPNWVPAAQVVGFQTPYVVIPQGVVAVYSRTIRFGGQSAWSD